MLRILAEKMEIFVCARVGGFCSIMVLKRAEKGIPFFFNSCLFLFSSIMILSWLFFLSFSGYFRFLPAFVIKKISVLLRTSLLYMVSADYSAGSRVKFSERISSVTVLTKEKDISSSEELLSCKQ